MQYLIFYSSLLIIFLISRLVFKDLKSKFYKKHQKFAGRESIPLIGGIIFFIYLSLNFEYFNEYILLFSLLILCLGISSDCDFINSPKIRLILQSSLMQKNQTYFQLDSLMIIRVLERFLVLTKVLI